MANLLKGNYKVKTKVFDKKEQNDDDDGYKEKALNSIKKPGIGVYNESVMLWKNFNIKVMHDPTEGGISAALYELSEGYNTGILVYKENLIFYPPVIKLAEIFNLNPYGLISSGCIVGITSSSDSEKLLRFMSKRKIKCSIIGEIVSEKGVFLKYENEIKEFPRFKRDEINKFNKE